MLPEKRTAFSRHATPGISNAERNRRAQHIATLGGKDAWVALELCAEPMKIAGELDEKGRVFILPARALHRNTKVASGAKGLPGERVNPLRLRPWK